MAVSARARKDNLWASDVNSGERAALIAPGSLLLVSGSRSLYPVNLTTSPSLHHLLGLVYTLLQPQTLCASYHSILRFNTMSKPPIVPETTVAGIAVDPRTLERVIPETRRPDGTYV